MKEFRLIIKYRRYLLVGLILVLVFLSGKNFSENYNYKAEKRIEELENELRLKQKDTLIISVGVEGQTKELSGIGKDNFYRFFYNIEVRDLNPKNQAKSVNLSMFIISDTGQRQFLDKIELKNNLIIYNRSVEFLAMDDSNKILFEKDNLEFSPTISISNLVISPLEVKNLSELEDLDETIVGTVGEKVIFETGKMASGEFILRAKNQSAGQFFVPDEKAISGFDFKLKFIGSGGFGSYYLELREVIDDEFKVGPIISKYYFNKEIANDYFKVGPSTYHFSLAQNLIPGKKYYVGISNAEVKTSYFHTLAVIAGSKTDSKTAFGAEIIDDKYKGTIDDLFLRIYSPNRGGSLLGGRLEDVGSGRLKYIYKQSGKPQDLLDISDLSSSGIYFDNKYGGIVGKSENNSAYIFKFIQQKTIKKIGIEFDDLGQGIVNSLAYYSYDGKNWQEIKVSEINYATTGKFRQALSPDDTTSTLYLKITYDPKDVEYKTFRFFGIQGLQVTMELEK